MLDVKYYKDYRHNYLIIKDNGGFADHLYQRKMITENQIKGLLPCRERHINGDMLLYYEITSKQNLTGICRMGSINMERLRSFFIQLKMVEDRLQKYLLSGSCLVLQPEYIYQELESGNYSFLYYPDSEYADSSDNGFQKLLDFFLAGVDNEDLEAVEIVYKIADLVQKEQFVLDEVLCWFQESAEKEETMKEPEAIKPPVFEEGIREQSCGEIEAEGQRWYHFPEPYLLGGGALLAGILAYITYVYQVSGERMLYLILGWIAAALLLAGAAGCALYRKIKGRGSQKAAPGREEPYRYMPTFEKEEPIPAADIGNTVYIPWSENCENKLYGMDKKNKYHIDLSRLPVTVGKLAGAVDMVISEQSISRMHAKFSRTGNQVYVTDLNSTNGTFRNGMRLEPNASEVIEPGDEIRLGKLKFIYR